ncbi:MAG: AAA family ATPase [Bryobacteraceae bacterium]
MAKLTRIGVGGFKSIKNLQPLDLRPTNILIGSNGAGKSNLISFLNLLRAIANGTLQEFVGRAGGAETLLYYGSKETPAMWAALDFTGKTGDGSYFFGLAPTATDTLVFTQEQAIYARTRGSDRQPKLLGSGHKESLLMADDNQFLEIWELLAGVHIFHFHDTSQTAHIRKHGYVEDNRCLRDDAGNLAAFLHGLKQRKPPYYRRIVEAIRQVAPFFDDFVLAPKVETDQRSILLNWKDRHSEHLFGPHQLSDGTLRAMALVTLLLQPEDELPALVVLDEPEIGMHPYAIDVLASLIRGASAHRSLIVATQSVSLLNYFEPEDIVVVSRSNGQSDFQRQNSQSLAAWLKEYSIGDLWEKNLIGGTPSR